MPLVRGIFRSCSGCFTRPRPFVIVGTGLLLLASSAGWTANVTYSYNANGQLTQANYDNGTVVTYAYDANGNRTVAQVNAPALETPTDLSANSTGASQIDLGWTGSSGATGYYIERCAGAGCTNYQQVGTAAGTSYSDSGLSPQTTYVYVVQAYETSSGNTITSATSSPASAETGADTTPPTTPVNLAASASASSIALSWTASTDNVRVAGYTVERCQGSSCSDFGQLATVAATSYVDSDGSQGVVYGYRVLAYDEAGNQSGWSNIASATVPDTTPPSVPTGVSASAQSWSTVSLSWAAATDNVGVAGYRVYRNGSAIGTTGGTSYTDGTTSPSTSYSYTVSAYDAAGNTSAQSGGAPVMTPTTPVPSTPTGLSGTPASDTSITITWNASSDAGGPGISGYHVYRNGALIANTSTTSFTDTGLTTFTSYQYAVAAYDDFGTTSSQDSADATVAYLITNSTGVFAPGYRISQNEIPYSPSEYYWEVFAPNGQEVAYAQTGANGYEPACYGNQAGSSSSAASGYELQSCILWAAPSAYQH